MTPQQAFLVAARVYGLYLAVSSIASFLLVADTLTTGSERIGISLAFQFLLGLLLLLQPGPVAALAFRGKDA
jgi:hypothetical protein